MKKKEYQISGIIEYAHAFSIEVTASSKKEAKRKLWDKLDDEINPDNAEYSGYKIDEVEETKEEEE